MTDPSKSAVLDQQLKQVSCQARWCHGQQNWSLNRVSRSRISMLWRAWWAGVAWWLHLQIVGSTVAYLAVVQRPVVVLTLVLLLGAALWLVRLPRRFKQLIGVVSLVVAATSWTMFATALAEPASRELADRIFDALWLPITASVLPILLAGLAHLLTNMIVTRP